MGKINSNFFRASLNAKSVKGFLMAAICLSTRGAHIGLKSYMAGTCDQACVVLSSNSLKSPACSCVFQKIFRHCGVEIKRGTIPRGGVLIWIV